VDALGMALNGPQFMNDTVTADSYIIEGKRFARVTAIVRFAFPDAFAAIPEKSKQFYFDRGTGNHKLWADVEEGIDGGFDYDPECEKYRAGHAKWLRDTGYKPLPGGIEMRVVNKDLGYAGTLDGIGTVGSRVWLVDKKTTCVAVEPTALQTALYLLAIPGYKFGEVERYGVGIRKEGDYRMSPRFPDTDENLARYWAQKYQEASK
jgi:hypothetical protein